MKKRMFFIAAILVVASVLTSCRPTRQTCPAYSDLAPATPTVEQSI